MSEELPTPVYHGAHGGQTPATPAACRAGRQLTLGRPPRSAAVVRRTRASEGGGPPHRAQGGDAARRWRAAGAGAPPSTSRTRGCPSSNWAAIDTGLQPAVESARSPGPVVARLRNPQSRLG